MYYLSYKICALGFNGVWILNKSETIVKIYKRWKMSMVRKNAKSLDKTSGSSARMSRIVCGRWSRSRCTVYLRHSPRMCRTLRCTLQVAHTGGGFPDRWNPRSRSDCTCSAGMTMRMGASVEAFDCEWRRARGMCLACAWEHSGVRPWRKVNCKVLQL
jgi:hypothetical protein